MKRFFQQRGQGTVELGMIMGLIAILCVTSIFLIAEYAGKTFNEEASDSNKTNQFNSDMASAAGNVTINSTSVSTTANTSTSSTSSLSTSSTIGTTTSSSSSSSSSTTTTSADVSPPAVSITKPTNNQYVSNPITLEISASDNTGVTSVTYATSGSNPITPASGSLSLVSGSASSGTWRVTIYESSSNNHKVTVTVRDAAGNYTTSTRSFK